MPYQLKSPFRIVLKSQLQSFYRQQKYQFSFLDQLVSIYYNKIS